LIEIPYEIQTINGGNFSDNMIRQVVEKHSAFGFYPIIRAYPKAEIHIDSILPHEDYIEFTWRSHFPGFKYNIYYSLEENGTYTKDNTNPVSDISGGNTYLLDGLEADKQYWIYIVSVDDNNVENATAIVGNNIEGTTLRVNKITARTITGGGLAP
jgi:hypothetical protein